MPYAIVMHLEEETAWRITTLWEILAEKDNDGRAKFSDEQIRFNYQPHITLAVVDYMAGPDALVETIKPIVGGWTPLSISLDTIAVLPRKPVAPMLARATV